jgi:hypothetical protein
MGSDQVFVLQKEDLDTDLIIHPEGDSVQIATYYQEGTWWGGEGNVSTHTLIFGNYEKATVRSPKEGESIAQVPYYTKYLAGDEWKGYWCLDGFFYSGLYAINQTPSIGQLNNGNIAAEKLTVRIHNPNNLTFSETKLRLYDNRYHGFIDIDKQADDTFIGNVYACRYKFDIVYEWVYPCNLPYNPWKVYWTISPVELDVELDTAPVIDIYLTGNVGIQSIQAEETVLKISPNPVFEKSFYYETSLPVKSAKSVIEIIGLNGQILVQYPIVENKGKITLPLNIAKGIYNVSLIVNMKKYGATKIIVQ